MHDLSNECREKTPINSVILVEINNPVSRGYATDLAEALNLPILVYIGSQKLPKEALGSATLTDIQRERIQALIPGAAVVTDLKDKADSIIVSNRLARIETSGRDRKGLKILAPQSERGFDPYGKKRILVPIGRVETSLKAHCQAVRIAKSTRATIVIYHTTRPKDGCTSTCWHEHMRDTTKDMLKIAKAICEAEGVAYDEVIASVFPRLICEGITGAAFDHDCNLIVMAIAEDVVFGSHSTQILDTSPIPVLVVE